MLMTTSERVSCVLWDWNGTMINDLSLCIRLLGELLEEQSLPPVSRQQYLEIFGFPISEYYRRAGFDFSRESYESLAARYIQRYSAAGCWLGPVPGTLELVNTLHRREILQGILSASDRKLLLRQLEHSGFPVKVFDQVMGLDNYYAVSKVELGTEWIRRNHHLPREVVLIGDTLHDAQVAEAMGCRCILVGWGHQSVSRLQKAGVPVVLSPEELGGLLAQWTAEQ